MHSECAHVPFASEHVRLSQTVRTSETHSPSQPELQQNGSTPQTDGGNGLAVVRVLEAVERALRSEHMSATVGGILADAR